MEEIDFDSEIEVALTFGLINEYAAEKLAAMAKDGLTEELWQGAIDHYHEATDAGVVNDRDFSIFFYIDLFADDLIRDVLGVKLSTDERAAFKQYLFENRDDLNLVSVDSFKNAAEKWARSSDDIDKRAYPNTGHVKAVEPAYDLNKWATLFVQIQNMIRTGFKPEAALERISNSLSIPEKYKFLLWANYHIKREFGKYNVNDSIRAREQELRRGDKMRNKIASDGQYYYIPKLLTKPEPHPEPAPLLTYDHDYDEQYAMDFEAARNKLMSRVFAIDKLLEKYRKVIKPEQIDAVEEALSELRKRIRKLRLASSMKDSIIKTANILNKLDFKDGAKELLAIAADEPAPGDGQAPATKVVEREFKAVPPEQREVALDEAIRRLTDIGSVLKNRDLVRSLAEIDLMLHKLRMASFFPEIQEAQSKLIDAFGYASNKVEDLLPKLRGGLQTQPDIVSEPAAEVAIPSAPSEKKQLGDEVKEMSAGIGKSPSKAPPAQKTPEKKPVEVEDEGFEDEPVSLKTIPGLE